MIKDKVKKLFADKTLLAIIGITLMIRLIGIRHGLPLLLNIDEPATVSATLSIKDNLSPDRFDWPHLFLYFNAAAYLVYTIVKYVISMFVENPFGEDLPNYLFITRMLVTSFAAGTIVPIYYSTKNLTNNKYIGYLAALMVAVLPIHVDESHLAKLDIVQTFFAACALYFIINVYKHGRLKDFIWAGVLIGLTTSVKYNGFLLFLPLLIAALLNKDSIKAWFDKLLFRNLFLSGVVSIITFYLGTPFALIDYNKFWSTERGVGALWQFQNVGKVEAAEYPASVYETFGSMYYQSLGPGLWILFLVLVVLFLFFNKRSKIYLLTLLPVIFLSLYISMLERSPAHYYLTFVPFYILALSNFIFEIGDYINQKVFTTIKNPKIAYILISLMVLLPNLILAIKISSIYQREDTRISAFNWVKKNLNENQDYLYVYGEELELVPFQKLNSTRIEKADPDYIEHVPFYLVIGVDDLPKEVLFYGDRDTEMIDGDPGRILQNADLVFESSDVGKMGPAIYIFHVNEIAPKKPKPSKN